MGSITEMNMNIEHIRYKGSIKNLTLYIITIFFISLFIILVYRNYQINSLLNDFDNTSVKEDNRLALYWHYVNYDPIFTIPYTDLVKMGQNLEDLERQLTELTEKYYQENSEEIKNTLYPIDFLNELKKLEELREDFLASPNRNKASTYHKQLLLTTRVYKDSLQKMTTALNDLDDLTLGFVSGTTSIKLVASRLDYVYKNMDPLLEIENKRFECLKLSLNDCINLKLPNQTKQKENLDSSTHNIISPEMLLYKDSLDAVYTKNTSSSTLIVLNKSLCYPDKTPTVYAYWEEIHPMAPDTLFIRATPVNDLFLQDLEKLAENAFYKKLADADLVYSLQPMNLYFCIDGGAEYQKLSTISKIYDISNNISFPEKKSTIMPLNIADILLNKPNKTTYDEVLYESVASNYVYKVNNIISNYSERELLTYMDMTSYKSLRDISLLWRTQSADFDELINTTVYLTETTKGILDAIEIPLEPLYLTRSYMSLLFMLSNQTINTEDLMLISALNKQSLDSFYSVSANELYRTMDDKKKLKIMLIENKKKSPISFK